MRKIFAKISTKNINDAGKAGERFAEEWFEKQKFQYTKLPQGVETKPQELIDCNAKRPDYELLSVDPNTMIMADAKYHKTENMSSFSLSDDELSQYYAFIKWVNSECPTAKVHILFLVIPQEALGDKLVVINITDFENAEETALGYKQVPGKKIMLTKQHHWFDLVEKTGTPKIV